MASRLNSFVVDVCTKRFTPLHFISQLLQKIRHRRKQKAFSFDGVLAQFVHVAFKRVVTLRLVPSIVLTTAIADIVFDAGWSESLFVNERKVKRYTATISLYVAVGL